MNLTVGRIQQVIAREFQIQTAALLGDGRTALLVRARQAAIWLSDKLTGETREAIGQQFNRDHTTVSYAIVTIDKKMTTDKAFADRILVLMDRLIAEMPGYIIPEDFLRAYDAGLVNA